MNWTIGAMRDINAADPVGGLGPRVTPAPTPAPAPVKRGDGFVVGPDGKLSTDLPDPTVPAVIGGVPVWPFPHMPKQEEPAGDVPLIVRVFESYPWKVMRGTNVRAEPYPGDVAALRPIDGEPGHGKFIFPLSQEGKTWERVA